MFRQPFLHRWIHKKLIVCLCTAMLIAISASAFAVRPGEISLAAEMSAGRRAVAAMHPDKKIRNSDYLAEKLVSEDFWHYYHFSRDFENSMKFVKTFRLGFYFYDNARTKHIDKIFQDTAKNGLDQVVILGAGLDSRAYRFAEMLPGARFFELDHPPTAAHKQKKIKEIFGEIPRHVTFVPIDFNTWNIGEALEKAGYDPQKNTCFIWAGVSMYLTREAVDHTLRFMADKSASGSTVIFDYILETAIQRDSKKYPGARRFAFRMALAGEPILSGLPEGKEAAQAYINDRGLEVVSDVGPEELTKMYLIGTDGNPDGHPSKYLRIVHAQTKRD